ncbi:MAG: hypothetical protein MJ240_13800, partial [Kiritimatiellae bacterium]|nr:hypothetical protein [Kiritimatiellia bacterium]
GFSGRFENFRVRGGYVVTAEMKDGAPVDYAIKGVKPEDKVRVSCPTDPSFVQLPGEPAWKKPLPPGPFPDALSAYVFRNWGLVEPQVLAETIGASAAEITAVAVEMGLSPTPTVSPRWRDMGYVTILRRNWHLLPYAQLMKLVGKTRRQMRYALVEDDYLGSKLGMPKPNCPRLVYTAAAAAAGRQARLRLRESLTADGVKIVDAAEVPRFSFLDNFGKLPHGASAQRNESARFDLRMIYPFSLDYGDPLADDDVASCPEGLVADLSARGVNAIWMHVVLSTLTTDARYPEFGRDAARHVANLRKLVARCAKWGVKVILYINEPRAQPAAFFTLAERAAMRGSVDDHNGLAYCRCTRHPDTLRWLRDSLRQLFAAVPGLGGVFTITMSENATHCGSQYRNPDLVTCPRCRGRSIADLVVDVNRAIFEGVKAGSPAAHVIFNDTAWELVDDPLTTIVPRLPPEGRLVVWSEKYLPFTQGGLALKVNEYSISHPGPAERALGYWAAAKRAGLKADAKLQVNDCWEISAVPYLPVMDLVAEHADNLSRGCVDGVMLSWSLGGYPGPGLELFRRFRKGSNDPVSILDGLAEDLYGKPAAPFVRKAWAAYSAAYRNYPMQWQTVYYSPVQMGPANLLYAAKTDWRATMVNTPYDDLARWTGGYGTNTALWVAQMRQTAEGFDQADALWREALSHCAGAARETAERDRVVFRAATLHFRTSVDQADFIQARDRGDLPAMRAAARRELATAKEMLDLVRRESALGYESSNRYMYVPNDLLEKILNCRSVLDH